MEANLSPAPDVAEAIARAAKTEESPLGREVLRQILRNHRVAARRRLPVCQDTGFAVVFLDVGQEVRLVGGNLEEAVNEGVRRGYAEGHLRSSIVDDPVFARRNTGDNTPAMIHTRIVAGNSVQLVLAPKGGGAENMSKVRMMTAADGMDGIMDFVVDRVRRSGGNPCPPVIVGVGVGGTFEGCALLAKRALLRPIDTRHADPRYAGAEREMLRRINALGIGPQGFGGSTTALGVCVETFPCHMATMPVAVNIQCHAARHVRRVIGGGGE